MRRWRWAIGAVAILGLGWLGLAEGWRHLAKRGLTQAITDQGGQVAAVFQTAPAPLWPRHMRAQIATLTLPVEGLRLEGLTVQTGTPLPHRWAVSQQGPLTLRTPTGPAVIDAETLTGFVRVARRPALPLEEARLAVAGLIARLPGDEALRLEHLTGALTHQGEGRYEVQIAGDGLIPSDPMMAAMDPQGRLARRVGPVRGDAVASFAAPLSPRQERQPPLHGLHLHQLEAEWGAMRLTATADLTFDDQGRGTGEIALSLTGWEDILTVAEDTGLIAVNLAARLRVALRFAARRGTEGQLEVTLSARDGGLYLGPIPVGEIVLPQS